eukprot:Plantae.Rhodophyta-Purpureofilum_apyrenoidigerum.ctg19704.p1 GENE.Plantae.Rhodophyta-Purpureofilum_apyrenoidigerum.ctg19704~~Plantae.Rhodophyta-Purpureofilum_apyrenoidigerum.ctg19704.p1  ORF type:complete len:298 (+),score=68.24 Plantae.Rhodophyta-Purpureofilum_apyrenoidigerum.ctg19704:96-989(+)
MAFVSGLSVGSRGFVGSTGAARSTCRAPRRTAGTVIRMDTEESGNDAQEQPEIPKTEDSGEVSSLKLLRSDILEDLRVKYKKMGFKLNKLVREEKYMEAAKVRDDMRKAQDMDPYLKYEQLLKELKLKEKEEDYQACIKVRDEMRQLKQQVNFLNIEGLWSGNQGQAHFHLDGMKLIARRAADDKNFKKGEVVFEADLSVRSMMDPAEDKKLDLIIKVIPGVKPKQVFHGRGTVASEGYKQALDGFFVVFERDVCAFIFSSLSVLVLYQRQRGNLKSQGKKPQTNWPAGGTKPPLRG